jgi:hypothetical protein
MSEPVDELRDFVALLRSATPHEDMVATARAGVMKHAPSPILGSLVVRFTVATLAIVALSGPDVESVLATTKIVHIEPAIEVGLATVEPPEREEPAPIAEPAPPVRPRREARATPAPADDGASADLAGALRDYAAERYPSACVALSHVVEGGSSDSRARVAEAEFFLAKCLYHIGLYHASAAAFDEISRRGESHPYFGASLRWFALLADRIPEQSELLEAVGRYGAEDLEALDTPSTRAIHQRLTYLLGRSRYEEGRHAEAARLLSRVPDGTRWALHARFFQGVSHVRMHRARPALSAFRRVIDSVRAGRTGGQ